MHNLYYLAHDGVDHSNSTEALGHQAGSTTLLIVAAAIIVIGLALVIRRSGKTSKKRSKD